MLEVLKVLESEVNLREDTRVAEQARKAVVRKKYLERAEGLAETQSGLGTRVKKVIDRILELPDAAEQFGKELQLLTEVSRVMSEAADILSEPHTGRLAIAAETEAIELLLQSRRINPGGGGGGGSAPGGGGGGTTTDSALALVGSGVNEKEVREATGVSQVTGKTGSKFPEEFRAGLDEYFNQLEQVR